MFQRGGPGQCWDGSISSAVGQLENTEVREEREVGPASALIWEGFENYFMPVSSSDFDNMEGRRS